MKMRTAAALLGATALTLSSTVALHAESVGYVTYTVPPNTERFVSVPFTRDFVAEFTVASVSGNVVTVNETIVQTAGAYGNVTPVPPTNPHYLRNATTGRWSGITANTTGLGGTITVQDGSLFSAGQTIRVFPHYTLASVFPDVLRYSTAAIPNVPQTSASYIPAGTAGKTETVVLLPRPDSDIGQNKNFTETYRYVGGGALQWRRLNPSGGTTNYDTTILAPQSFFILRNQDATSTLVYYGLGDVTATTVADFVPDTGVSTDIYRSALNELPTTLGSGPFLSLLSRMQTGASGVRDFLLVYPVTGTGVNQPIPATSSYFVGGGVWRRATDSAVATNFVIPAGSALIIRRTVGAPTDATNVWTTAP